MAYAEFTGELDAPEKGFVPFDGELDKEPGGFVASAKQSIGAAIRGAGQAAADFIPGVSQDNPVKRYGQEVIKANPTAVNSFADIADKPGTAVAEATGNAASSIGGPLAARALGMGITAAAPLTGPAAPVTAAIGQVIAWLGPPAIAALPSFGSIRDKQMLSDPQTEDSAKAKAIAALGAGTVGLIESKFGPQQWAMAALTREGRAQLAKKFAETGILKGLGYGAAKGAAVEGAEELVQNPIEQAASFQDPTTPQNLKETAFGGAMGALGGGVLGGGTGVAVNLMPQKTAQDILAAPDIDSAIQTATEVLALPAPGANPGETILATERGTAGTAAQFDMLRRQADVREAGGGMGRNADITDVEAKAPAAPIQNDPAALLDRQNGDPLAPMVEDRRIRTEAQDALAREAEQRKAAEMEAIPEMATEQNAVQAALARAGTLEAPTAMELALQRARGAQAPAPAPAATVEAAVDTPPLPRIVERTPEMVAMPQKLAEQRAAADPSLEVVRIVNRSGKTAFTVIPKAADVSNSVEAPGAVPSGVDGRGADVGGSEPAGGLGDGGRGAAPEPERSGGADVAVGRGAGQPAAVEPQATWFGRRGDGYLTEGDAQMAIPSRQRVNPDLRWAVERMPSGKFRLAGYAQEKAPVVAVARRAEPVAAPQSAPESAASGAAGQSLSDAPEKWAAKTAEYAKSIAPSAERVGQVAGYSLLRDTRPDWNQDDDGRILAVDKTGNVVADVFFGRRDDGKLEAAAEVAPAARRQGIASAIYDQIERTRGERLAPAEQQTADARAFWEARRREAGATEKPDTATAAPAAPTERERINAMTQAAKERRQAAATAKQERQQAEVEKARGKADAEPSAAPEAAAEGGKDDRDHFTLQRLNRDTNKMEPVTFARGEYVRFQVGGKDQFGDIDGISHAKRQFSVDGLWHDFGFAYKAERPAAPRPKGAKPLSKVIESVNRKNAAGLTDDDRVQFSVNRRAFVIGTAAALADPAGAATTLGKAKPIPATVLNQRLPAAVEKLLVGQRHGVTNIDGAKALREALQIIATTGPQELRALASEIRNLMPEKGVALQVDKGDWTAHGAVEIEPMVRLRLFDGKASQGMDYDTFLHESLHVAVAARYRSLSVGVVRDNDAMLGLSAPAAAKALEQFRAVWDEFRAASYPTLRELPADSDLRLTLEEARRTPDEFFVRALTEPRLQAWMAQQEYQGKTLWERFKDWVKKGLTIFHKPTGTQASWLDAALAASDDVLKAMSGDKPDFARLRAISRFNSRASDRRSAIDAEDVMASRAQPDEDSSLSYEEVENIVDELTAKWQNRPDIRVLDSMSEAPPKVLKQYLAQRSQGTHSRVHGFHLEGIVYIVAEEMTSRERVQEVLFHEALGHHGLRGWLGDMLRPMLADVILGQREKVIAKAKACGLNMNKQADRLMAAEEVLAELAQVRPELGVIRRLVAAIRTWLRDNIPSFAKMKMTDDELIRKFVIPARGFVERGQSPRPTFTIEGDEGPETVFSLGDKQPPIVKYRKELARIEQTLPALEDGMTRLWRGNRPGEIGQNPSFTDDAAGIALPFRDFYQGTLSYVDVPTADMPKYVQNIGTAQDAEFILPAKLAALAREVRVTSRRAPDSGAFRAWFKGSKVVDADGAPLVVYHGTGSDFSAFSTDGRKYTNGLRTAGAVWFTPSPQQASWSAENLPKMRGENNAAPNVMPVYLSLQNPLVIKDHTELTEFGHSIFHSFGAYPTNAHRNALLESGFDGVIVTPTGQAKDATEILAFRPNQIKSAIGNNGNFDPEDNRVQFSLRSAVTNKVLPKTWQAPDESKLDDFIYTVQDKHIDTKRAVQAVRDAIGAIADEQDPYLQEELFHGRAAMATKEFLEKQLRPLLVEMQARGVEMSDFEEYLHNRHAERRNVQVAKVNPKMQDGGSGIKTADARAYLAGLPAAKRKAYEALAKRVEAINRDTRKLLVSSGLEKQTTIDAWEAAYGDEYVPLMREEMDDGTTGIGQGYSVRGSASKRAMGSDKPVANIIANIALQRERTITRAEKKRIGEALYGLVLKAPNDEFWFAIDPQLSPSNVMATQMQLIAMGLDPADAESIAQEPKSRYVDKATGLVTERINPALRGMDNVLAVRIDGEDKFVFFNKEDPRAMRMVTALKNLDADQLGTVMGTVAKMTRWFASVNTQFNPVFGVTNITRDVQTALLNLSSTPLKNHRADVLKHTLSALRGIYIDLRDHRAGKQPSSVWAGLFEEFQREGGATGYRDMYANAQERADQIAAELRAVNDGAAMKLGKGIMGWLSDYNETMENSVRLAAYKVGKEQGLSNQQAASLAKNLTVNFNRKGQVALQVGALYAFFNASTQGMARMGQTMFEGGKLSATGRKILAGGLLLGSMQALLLAAAGYDDDEPPDFVRERALVLPVGGGKYVAIPMPLGFHVIPNLGRIPTEWALGGFKNTTKYLAQIVDVASDAFNPIGSAGLSLQTLAPTVIDPLAALSENRDWTGKPIAKKDFDANRPTAGHTRAKDTATPWAKMISYGINIATGGTDYKPGMASPTPDQIDYLIGQVTGGVGREVGKLAQVASGTMSGEEVPMHKIPLVGRFVGTTEGQAAEAARFYDNLREIGAHKVEIDGLRRDRKGAEIAAYIRENKAARLVPMADSIQREVSEMQKRKRELIKQDASRERIKLMDQQITARMKRLNDRARKMEEATN